MKYIKEELETIVKDVLSTADVCRRLNIKPVGGNYKTLKKYYKLYDIDISHFTGKAWNVGDRFTNFSKKFTLDEICIKDSTYTNTSSLKQRLVKEGIKENKCEECKIENWCDKPLTLHLDHINGDNTDNRIVNLRILCPNCHSQTDTYCNTRRKKTSKKEYCSCGATIRSTSKSCRECQLHSMRKVERPTLEELMKDIKELGYSGTGRKYGVSDNSIRKWIK